MFAKSTQIGLVSLFAMIAMALGGCAASVGHEPASFPTSDLAELSAAHVVDAKPVAKIAVQALAPQIDSRPASAAPPPSSLVRRREDCGR